MTGARRKSMLKKIFLALVFASGLIFSPAMFANPVKDVYVFVLVLDGLNYNSFQNALDKSELPNIKKYFIEDGLFFTDATTVFPSVSAAAYQSIVSGLFPGHAGVAYLSRFDRERRKPIDYLSISGFKRVGADFSNFKDTSFGEKSTIFSILDSESTAGVYSFFNLGAKVVLPKIPIFAGWSMFGSGKEEALDKSAFNYLRGLIDRPAGQIPRFTLVGLYGGDALAHHYGTRSEMVRFNLGQLDLLLGDLIELLKKRDIFDRTYIVLLADHGMHDTPKGNFDINDFLAGQGLVLYTGGNEKYFNCYVAERGVTSAQIYLKGRAGWDRPPVYDEIRDYQLGSGDKIDVVEKLLDAPEIKFVLVRGSFQQTHVFSKTGHSIITWREEKSGDEYRYDVVAAGGLDPLGIASSRARGMVNKGFFGAVKWGKMTYDHVYPDAVVQLSQVFHDGVSGEIYIVPEDDHVFYRKKAASHGSIVKDDMHIPILIHGPGIEKGSRAHIRITDLYPMMLDWFGITPDPKTHDFDTAWTTAK